jgi:hypothetical protein
MPAFTFEKITPPAQPASNPAPEKKQRGMIVQILDRVGNARGKRVVKSDRTVVVSEEPKS